MKLIYKTFILLSLTTMFFSCANRGMGPQGGKQDITPPQLLRSLPENGATNFLGKEIEIQFNELFTIKQPSENVIFSPPQLQQPSVVAAGKSLRITFLDEMQPNTTYAIDFGNAIEDNTEHNALQNFVFSFSTGESIDSLQIAGSVLNAADLNPVAGVFVGIHSNQNDTAFTKMPFLRLSKTDETGSFRLTNMPEGKYRVFALKDKNRSFSFDNPAEDVAWNDSLVIPSFQIVTRPDTIWKDTLTVDTVLQKTVTDFHPADLVLRLFNEDFKRQFLVKSERNAQFVRFFFNAPQPVLPKIEAMNFNLDKTILQKTAKNDTLTYWLKDTLLLKQDTLKWQITYPRTLISGKDSVVTEKANLTLRRKAKREPVPLKFKSNISAKFNPNDSIFLTFVEPVDEINTDSIHFYQQQDTLWVEKTATLEKTHNILQFKLNANLKAEENYKLQLDSAAVTGIFGNKNSKYESKFKVRSLEEYAVLIVTLPPVENAVLQLISASDAVIKTQPAGEEETVIEFIEPGTYYLRLFIDQNRNGIWDTGNFAEHRQPETVHYFNEAIQLRANWDVEVEWTEFKPVMQQKPETLRKVIK